MTARRVYHVFYRNLFARLRSPDQAIFIQLLSSSFVIFWYPISMSKTFHRLLKWAVGYEGEWEEYAEGVGIREWGRARLKTRVLTSWLYFMAVLYLRNLSENVTSKLDSLDRSQPITDGNFYSQWLLSLAGYAILVVNVVLQEMNSRPLFVPRLAHHLALWAK